MKNFVVMLLFVVTGAFAQRSQERVIGDFTALKASNGIEVKYTQGGANSLLVEVTNEEIMQYVSTVVNKKGVLVISLDIPNKLFNNKKFNEDIVVTVSGGPLNTISATTSANINVLNSIKQKSLEVSATTSGKISLLKVEVDELLVNAGTSARISGDFKVVDKTILTATTSAKIDVELFSDRVNASSSTSSKITLSGSAKEVEASASTSSNIDGDSFNTKKLFAQATTSGTVKMKVSELLNASASTSGKVLYYGNPVIEKQNKTTGGSIKGQ